MIDVFSLFSIMNESDREQMTLICVDWKIKRIKSDSITITCAESDMLHSHGELITTVRMIRDRTGCGLMVAKDVCDRERALRKEKGL